MAASAPLFDLTCGTVPLVVSMPHSGTDLPEDIAARMTDAARALPDTDWFVPELYGFLRDLGCSRIVARTSRYVVDLNRPADGGALYAGQRETEVCPTSTFGDAPVYREGCAPDEEEVAARIERYWRPYHAALAEELARVHARHGYALLWDAHSIAGRVPRFFDGDLPVLNIGTRDGESCAAGIGEGLLAAAGSFPVSCVLNGRFRGGYITRHYGNPAGGVHAVQLEISQAGYMGAGGAPALDWKKTGRLVPVIRAMVDRFLEVRP